LEELCFVFLRGASGTRPALINCTHSSIHSHTHPSICPTNKRDISIHPSTIQQMCSKRLLCRLLAQKIWWKLQVSMSISASKPIVLKQQQFCPPRDIWNVWRYLWLSQLGGGVLLVSSE
jgi:hypothetical protein